MVFERQPIKKAFDLYMESVFENPPAKEHVVYKYLCETYYAGVAFALSAQNEPLTKMSMMLELCEFIEKIKEQEQKDAILEINPEDASAPRN